MTTNMSPSASSAVCSAAAAVAADAATSSSILDGEANGIVGKYVTDIINCYNTLVGLPDLQPCVSVNKAFGELVVICTQIPEESIVHAILGNPQVAQIMFRLQQMCSCGECNLEKYWALKIVTASQCQDGLTSALASFPYYSNYVDLTQMELSALHSASPGTPLTRFAFLGCGPLPLTSLCILSHLSSPPFPPSRSRPDPPTPTPPFILNIDWSPDAIACATRLCQRLAISSSSIAFSCDCAGGAQNDLRGFDVVYVAALVGATAAEKRDIFRRVLERMRPGALLVVRTAHALRTLLYPVVRTATDLDPDAFEPLMVVHPYNHIINSVIIGRVRSPKVI